MDVSISKLSGLVVVMLLVCVSVGRTELKVQGAGKKQQLVRDQFAPATRPEYDLFATKCTKCHEMARPIMALKTGITPISGGAFEEKGIKEYVVKMMRKPNSGITKDDAKKIIDFLRQARAFASN